MRPEEIEKARREARDSPVGWFVELSLARKKGDFERAAQAVRELKRLGVTVRYGMRPVGEHHAV